MDSDSEFSSAISSLSVGELKAGKEANANGYVPLGVWISNWPDLFPWMAQGYYNNIDNIEGENAVRERVMLQDYQTLSRLYYIANSSGITEFKRKAEDPSRPLPPSVTSLSIADAFANAAGKMQESQGDLRRIREIYKGLGEAAQHIYVLWNKIAFLRNCELGLGLIKNSKSIGDPIENKDKNNDHTRQAYSLGTCGFDGRNYTVFSRFNKVLPLITPEWGHLGFWPRRGRAEFCL